jgi:hypothetical protein
MDRDHVIITVYCLVCEHYRPIAAHVPIRRGGFAPELTDEEVITIELCGEYFKLACDADIFAYFRSHYRHFFPRLRDRPRFARQAADVWQVKALIPQRLVPMSGQASDPVQAIDTVPLPVCGDTRSARDRCFKPHADYGHGAAKNLDYYGFKLGLRVARSGMITHFPLLPARPHDIHLLDTLVEGWVGVAPADKGFIDAFRQALLEERHGILVVTPVRKRMQAKYPTSVLRVSGRWRKRLETVGSHLTERCAIAHPRP